MDLRGDELLLSLIGVLSKNAEHSDALVEVNWEVLEDIIHCIQRLQMFPYSREQITEVIHVLQERSLLLIPSQIPEGALLVNLLDPE